MVYIASLCFESTFIVKPYRSRIVNSERYLVGKGFHKRTPALDRLITHMEKMHREWPDDLEDAQGHPESFVPRELMQKNDKFQKSFSASCIDLCKKQTIALKAVMDLSVVFKNKMEENKDKEKTSTDKDKEKDTPESKEEPKEDKK